MYIITNTAVGFLLFNEQEEPMRECTLTPTEDPTRLSNNSAVFKSCCFLQASPQNSYKICTSPGSINLIFPIYNTEICTLTPGSPPEGISGNWCLMWDNVSCGSVGREECGNGY